MHKQTNISCNIYTYMHTKDLYTMIFALNAEA